MPKLQETDENVLLSFAEKVDRNDPNALNNLGVLYYRKGMHEKAIEQFKDALKIDAKFDLALENLEYVFRTTKLQDPDVRHWEEVVLDDPGNEEALLRLGVSYHLTGRLDEATQVLNQLVKSNPTHVLGRIRLGNVLKSKGRYDEALEQYLAVRKQMTNHAVFQTDLGEIYYNIGRTGDAIAALKKAIELDGEYWRPYYLLSFAYGDEGQLEDALEASRMASRLSPSVQNVGANLALGEPEQRAQNEDKKDAEPEEGSESALLTLGIAYAERGYYKEALAEFSRALVDVPDKDRVEIEMAKVHLAEGDLQEAAGRMLRALEFNPENYSAYRMLGNEHHIVGNLMAAAACYLEAYRLQSTDPDTINNIGALLFQVGLWDDAERMFKIGLNRCRYHVELNYNFLNALMRKKEYSMADHFLQQREQWVGRSALFYERRADLNLKLGRVDDALADIESAQAADGMRSNALYLKGFAMVAREEYDSAIKAIVAAVRIRERFTGKDLMLACEHRQHQGAVTVTPAPSMEPGEELVVLLRSGASRQFEGLADALTAARTAELCAPSLSETED